MTITVLSVEQGDKSAALITPHLLMGRWNKPLYRFVHVPVAPTYDPNDHGRTAAETIAEAAHSTPGQKILVGNSTGAAYVSLAVRKGLLNGIPPTELTLWMLANPERYYGGWCTVPRPLTSVMGEATWGLKIDAQVGIPWGIPWQVYDFAQIYDVCADAATSPDPGFWYKLYAGSMGLATHLNYFTVSPDDSCVKRYDVGNIHYMLHAPRLNSGFEQFYSRPPWR